MHIFDAGQSMRTITQVTQPQLARKSHVCFQPLLVPEFFFPRFLCFSEFLSHLLEEVRDWLGLNRSGTADLTVTRLYIDFYVCNPCPILTPVVLLLHEDVHPVHGIRRAVFFDIIRKGLSEAVKGYSAFMKNLVAHFNGLKNTVRPGCLYLQENT